MTPPKPPVLDRRGVARRSRGWVTATLLFGVVILAAVVISLWAASNPNGSIRPDLLALMLLFWAGNCWIAFLVTAVSLRRKPPMVVMLTPLFGLAVWGVVSADLPQKARWSYSEPAFEALVQRLGPPTVLPDVPESVDVKLAKVKPCPAKIGLYDISQCKAFPAGYLFFDSEGANWLDDAGIAYLPAGVPHHADTDDFESPHFTHLNGNWYAFTSSW